MRTFTRLFLSLSTIALGLSATAQYDIEATAVAVSATGSNLVFPGYQTPIAYQITNTGTATLLSTDRYYRTVLVDGQALIGPDTFIFGADVPAAAAFNSTVAGGQLLYNFGTTIGDQNICIEAGLVDSTETNLFNNNACQVITVSNSVSNDWICDTVEIFNWQDLDGHIVVDGDPAPEIDSLSITITNNAALPFWGGSAFRMNLISESDSLTFDGVFNGSIDTNQTVTFTFTPNLGIPNVQQTDGTHDFCIRLRQLNDDVGANDIACTSYKIKVPPPTGVNDPLAEINYNVFLAQDFIMVDGIQNNANVLVMDATGKVLTQQVMEANDRISASDLASGVYIVRVSSNDNTTVHTQRVVKN